MPWGIPMPVLPGSELLIVAGFAAAFLVLFALQVGALVGRRRFTSAVQREVRALRAAHAATRKALEAAEAKIARAERELSTRAEAQEKKMVRELQMLERLMRDFAAKAAQEPAAAAQNYERPQTRAPFAPRPQASGLLDIVKRALEDNRVDLYLQPVVSLPQRKVRFYEALSRLRSEDGSVIMPAQYIKVAAPAGLMSVIDNLLLFRCVQVVKRLATKSRDIAIFCNISAATLADAEFFPQFLDFMKGHRNIAGQIVFEFPQSAIIGASAAEEDRLRGLSALGFRLSMDQVTKLDMDFGRAKRLGVHFVKLGAHMLMSGMAEARAKVAAEDFKTLLLRDGLNLIAERIEDEKTVLQMLDYSVDFGQGYLFGEPRAVRELADPQDARPAAPTPNTSKVLAGLPNRLAG